MKNQEKASAKPGGFFPADVQEQLKQVFSAVPHDMPVYLFTDRSRPQDEIETARRLFSALKEISGRIEFKEYDISAPEAGKWNVDRAPCLVFAPGEYNLKYLGLPLGEEGRTLIETLILLGLRSSRLSDQALKVLEKIKSPRKVRVFVSPTCPYCPQQAVNGVKAALARPGLVSLEIVDTSFNPDLAEQYSIFSVPQTWANEVLIAKGAQSPELFAASLDKLEEATYFIPESDAPRIEADLVIIGGGPAGLTAGIYAARSGLKTVIVERGNPGGQVAATPVVENYPGLAHIGGKNLVDIMVSHALEYVKIFPGEEVLEIKTGQPLEVTTSRRRFLGRALLLATGATHRRLGAPGEDRFAGRGVSYCSTCDGPLFKGRKVAMVGGGNSAVTEALHLHHIGAQVTLIHRGDRLKAQEPLVRDLQANAIPVLWNTEVKEIKGREKVSELVLHNNQTGRTDTLSVDGLFIAIGYRPEVELARKIGVELTPAGYIKQDGLHRTGVPGVYSAGDVEGGYKQIVTAAGAAAAAAMTIYEDLMHPYWKETG
ncbi:MAG: FAD-dependent oxidoreductase [Thermodesulfobacteriota bacterium]